jgi:hypothetical protein
MLTQPDTTVEEFDALVEEIRSMTNDSVLDQLLYKGLRSTRRLALRLSVLSNPEYKFEAVDKLVGMIRDGGDVSDIDPEILSSINVATKARRAFVLYARIHGADIKDADVNAPDIDWTLVDNIDRITGQPPLCMTCGTKMRPAGSFYVCEGCGSNQNVPT